ncbi:MAG: hypothetical protein ACK51F_03790 [Rhodospirillales bacterium]
MTRDTRPCVVILSRGARLAAMYREAAMGLATDCRVVVLMYDETEHEVWRGTPGVEVIDLAARMADAVATQGSGLAHRAAQIERATGLPMYKAASNYLLYRRFSKSYTGVWAPFYDTEEHIMGEYVGAHEALCEVFDALSPDLVVHEALDLVTTLVALALSRRRGIFTMGWMYAPGMPEGTIFFYHGLRRQNFMATHLLANRDRISHEKLSAARDLIARTRNAGPPVLTHVENRRAQLRRPWWSSRNLYAYGAWRSPSRLVERAANLRWLDRNLLREAPAGPFILFLMHLQPEASTASQAPRWVDQERIVEQICINAPSGIRIVVKENPQCYGWRGRNYFGPLRELPNVDLCHPLVPTRPLIERAEALITITGSAGLEALLLGKRVAVLGRPFYSEFPGVRHLDAPEQIFQELSDPNWVASQDPDTIVPAIAAYLQSVHAMGDVEPPRKWPVPTVMGPRFGAAVRSTMDKILQDGLRAAQFDPGYPFDEKACVA